MERMFARSKLIELVDEFLRECEFDYEEFEDWVTEFQDWLEARGVQ